MPVPAFAWDTVILQSTAKVSSLRMMQPFSRLSVVAVRTARWVISLPLHASRPSSIFSRDAKHIDYLYAKASGFRNSFSALPIKRQIPLRLLTESLQKC